MLTPDAKRLIDRRPKFMEAGLQAVNQKHFQVGQRVYVTPKNFRIHYTGEVRGITYEPFLRGDAKVGITYHILSDDDDQIACEHENLVTAFDGTRPFRIKDRVLIKEDDGKETVGVIVDEHPKAGDFTVEYKKFVRVPPHLLTRLA